MLPSILAKEIIKGLQAYILTGYETPTRHFSGAFKELVETPGRFFKGPYLTLDLPFQQGDAGTDYFNGLTTDYPPYHHQQQAWQRLASDRDAKSTLIATGTGSGKTECFLYPLLDHCVRRPDSGVKAIVIYPMNALATDQAKRFAKTIHQSDELRGKIRVGLFVGGMEDNPSKSMGADAVITDKDILRDHPPDVLLTNYKMLDFLLLRPRDQKLWSNNGSDTLRYLIVDELHTFDGAQGTDLACLIRRLKARLLPSGGSNLICAGTSATLGDTEQRAELTKYAAQIFQSQFDSDAIIGETRQGVGDFLDQPIKHLFTPTEGMADTLDFSRYTEPHEYVTAQYQLFFPDMGGKPVADSSEMSWRIELGKQLKQHLLFNNLLRILGRQPKSVELVANELVTTLPKGDARALTAQLLDALCALISIALGEQGQPLVNLRLQLWVRELRRMVAPILPEPADGRVGIEFADDREPKESGIVLPLVQCNHCHATAWLTRRIESSQQVQTDLRVIYNDFFRLQPESQVLLPLEKAETLPDSEGIEKWLCGTCGQLQGTDGDCLACGDDELQRVFVPNLIRQKRVNGNPRLVSERNCPVCGQKDALLIFGARSTSLSSVAIHHGFATPFNNDKKLIAFSDSVQDSAHRAGFFAARTWQNNLRMAIARALPEQGMALPEFWQHLPQFWLNKDKNPHAMSKEEFVVEFIAPNMQYFHDFAELEKTDKLPQESNLVTEINKRLVWEVLAEFGYRSGIGRSLDRTAVASLGFDLKLLDQATQGLLIPLREHEGLSDISEQGLRWFLLGILLRMKQRGGIYHQMLESYIESGCKSFVLHRVSYLPDFYRQSHRPVFLLEGRASAGLDGLIGDRGRSWYQRWLDKTLGAEQLMMPEKAEAGIYARAFTQLESVGLLKALEYKGQTVWALNPDFLRIGVEVSVFETQQTRDRLFVTRDMAPWVKGMPSLDVSDPGTYLASVSPESWLSHIYRGGDIRRVIAREHTGLLDRETRQVLEKNFMDGSKPWQPNLLSATPTLEMGIDIGKLSSLLLCSVPPTQANYLQRVGRAGRKDGNAFNLTLAAGSPHDLYFFADPLQMMAGKVEPPGVFLNASAVISRQLTAYCMDRWVATGISQDAIPRTLKPVLDSVKNAEIHHFPYNFLAFVSGHALPLLDGFFGLFENELSDITQTYLQQFILGEGENDGLEMRLVKRLSAMVQERDGFRKQINQLKRHLDKLAKLPQDEATLEEQEETRGEREAMQAMLRRLNGRQALNFLTDEGVIPNYAFPEEGVTLRSVIYRRKIKTEDGGKTYENVVFEYERPGTSAISELVPKNRFYAGGRKVAISQIDLKLSEFESWRFCPGCSFSRREAGETDTATCPRCGDPMWSDSGQRATMLRLKQVMANTSDRDSRIGDDSDDRDSHFFNKQMLVDISPEGIGPAYRVASEDVPFGFEFVRHATFREINFGEYGLGEESAIGGEVLARSGFSLCKHCGMVQGKQQGKQPHAYTCSARKGDPEDESNFIDCLYLYREFSSEALRILLPIFALEGVERPLNSFIAALQLGLKLKFGGQVDHLRVMTYSEPISESDSRRRYLMLYDSVPGGTGYLQDLMQSPAALLEVFQKALDSMTSCACNHEIDKDGCYRCLYAYRNSYGMESTSRTTAVELLGGILAHADQFETIETIEHIQINPVFDSELEKLFINALAKPKAIDQAVKIRQQVVNGKPGYFLTVDDHYYTVEPQVTLGTEQGVALPSKPDFMIRTASADEADQFVPVAVFLDGFKYHKRSIADDSAKRFALLQSQQYRVCSLTWDDVQDHYAGKIISSQNPFSENLNPEMKPIQDKLLEKLEIEDLYKVALLPAMSMLLRYLGNPDDQDWAGLALVRMLGWFDNRNMMDETTSARVQGSLQQRAPAQFIEVLNETGKSAFGSSSGKHDAGLAIDCMIPLDAIKHHDPGTTMCNVWIDDHLVDDEAFKSHWQAFLKAYNLLQFLPLCGFSSAKGIQSGVYEVVPFGKASVKIEHSKDVANGALLEEVLENVRPALSQWLDAGGIAPSVGYEYADDEGEIIAEAELCWNDHTIAGLLEEQQEYQQVLKEQGWQVITLDDAGQWLKTHPLASSAGIH